MQRPDTTGPGIAVVRLALAKSTDGGLHTVEHALDLVQMVRDQIGDDGHHAVDGPMTIGPSQESPATTSGHREIAIGRCAFLPGR